MTDVRSMLGQIGQRAGWTIEEALEAMDRLSARVVVLDGAAHPSTEALAEKVERLKVQLESAEALKAQYQREMDDALARELTLKRQLAVSQERLTRAQSLEWVMTRALAEFQARNPGALGAALGVDTPSSAIYETLEKDRRE